MRYLLDTCVVSELIAKRPNQAVLSWLNSQAMSNLYLSVITIGELTRGIHRLPDSSRKSTLENWLNNDLLLQFSGRVFNLDLDTMILWGNLIGTFEPQGRVLPLMDSLIAAIALHGSFTLVTRNEKDFVGIGLMILNPWQ